MAYAPLNAEIRRIVARTFAELGLSAGAEPCETILVRDGAYCGRRFDAEHGHAIWFVAEHQLVFFRADGSAIQAIELAQGASRIAA